MNKLFTTLLVFILAGCSTVKEVYTPPVEVKVPVWTPPTITMPFKPVLISNGSGDYDSASKNVEHDLVNVSQYALELEKLLKSVTSKNQ